MLSLVLNINSVAAVLGTILTVGNHFVINSLTSIFNTYSTLLTVAKYKGINADYVITGN